MPERLEIDPALLRQLASQHRQIARDTREWAKPPEEWLANFEPTYGKIANPVKIALVEYYKARQRAGEALALEHDQTAESLIISADSYERTDFEGAAGIARLGDDFVEGSGAASTTPPPAGPEGVSGGAPVGAPPPGVAASGGAGGATGSGTAAPPVVSGLTPPVGAMVRDEMTSDNAGTNGSVPPAGATTGATATAGGAVPPTGAGGLPLGAIGAGAGEDRPGTRVPADGTPAGGMAGVVPTPFAAAVAAAKDKAAEPDYVVGEQVSDDLIIARTLLGAVLAAVESSIGTTWAVAVLRGPAGAGLFINSNEGRGWLPAGLYLPREVSTPWQWDELLRTEDSSGSPWEGVADPARVLVEFGLAWGAKANAEIAALVSSGPIDPGLRAHLRDVPVQGMVGPSYDVDLRVITPDTIDRLGLTGSASAIESAAALPDAEIRAKCLELALDGHAQLGRSVNAPPESGGVRAIRDRILARLQSGLDVPRDWWNDLRDIDDLIAAAMISRRVDVGRVGLGDLRVDDEVAVVRTLAWERRCNELVFLLADTELNRQNLRDAVYTHEQVVGHPSFIAVPPQVSAGAEERIEVPAAAEGAISAPSDVVVPPPATSGPPSGASAPPPSTSPPGQENQ